MRPERHVPRRVHGADGMSARTVAAARRRRGGRRRVRTNGAAAGRRRLVRVGGRGRLLRMGHFALMRIMIGDDGFAAIALHHEAASVILVVSVERHIAPIGGRRRRGRMDDDRMRSADVVHSMR